jgi:hypothetical protein
MEKETKLCKACGIEKELDKFYKGSWGEFGRVSRCIECIKNGIEIPKDKPITEKDCREEAKKYKNRTEFRQFALKYLNKANELGILDELFSKRPLKYTLEECKDVAKKCKDYVEFRNTPHYQFCRTKGLLEEIQKVLPVKVKSNRGLTKEDIFEIASNCKSRSEFNIYDSTAYAKANELNIMDELFPKPKCEECYYRYCTSCKVCKDNNKFLKPTGMCRECRNTKDKERKKKDNLYKLTADLRSKLLKYFNRLNVKSEKRRNFDIMGCTFEEFKQHIERQFENWMNWENRGDVCEILEPNCSWDLDHIIPLSKAKTEEELYLLNHWSNFQPLCSYVNRYIKRDNVYPVTNLELKITIL